MPRKKKNESLQEMLGGLRQKLRDEETIPAQVEIIYRNPIDGLENSFYVSRSEFISVRDQLYQNKVSKGADASGVTLDTKFHFRKQKEQELKAQLPRQKSHISTWRK